MASTKKQPTFNPIKEERDGKKARSIIWTTETLEMALAGLDRGKRLIANPFYENKTYLLKSDLVFRHTDEEKAEWMKCKNDIRYFAEKYCKLMTPKGIRSIELREYQKRYLKHLEDHNMSIMVSCRQAGKCALLLNEIDAVIQWEKQNNLKYSCQELKKRWDSLYYIKKEDCYHLPLFELYNLYDHRLIWKIKYQLYKFLYNYEKRRHLAKD